MKKIIILLLALLLLIVFCACGSSAEKDIENAVQGETAEVEKPELSPLLLRIFTTKEEDARTYIYDTEGKLKTEIGQYSWQTTEYTYSDEGLLLSHKRASTYDENMKQVTSYEEVQYDANGSPIVIKDASGTWEYMYEYKENGSILSVICQYKNVNGNPIKKSFDFSAEAEEYYNAYQPLSGTLVLKTIRDNKYVTKYMILDDGSEIDIYEISSHELDEIGNVVKAVEKGGIMREDGGWITEYSTENEYDDAQNLIFSKTTNFETKETEEYYYLYGYYEVK